MDSPLCGADANRVADGYHDAFTLLEVPRLRRRRDDPAHRAAPRPGRRGDAAQARPAGAAGAPAHRPARAGAEPEPAAGGAGAPLPERHGFPLQGAGGRARRREAAARRARNPANPPRQQRGDAFDPTANPTGPGAPQPLGAPNASQPQRPARPAGNAVVTTPGQIIQGEENAIGRDPRQPADLSPRGSTASIPIQPARRAGKSTSAGSSSPTASTKPPKARSGTSRGAVRTTAC